MLKLRLQRLPALRGIYGANRDRLGDHQLWAHPDLALAIAELEAAGIRLVYSDIYRSPQASRDARRAKPGLVQPAGFSPHNAGLAVDIYVDQVLKERRCTKPELDALLAKFGLYCHRRDGKLAPECWHYNAIGRQGAHWLAVATTSTAPAVEAKIQALYGPGLTQSRDEVIAGLRKLGHLKSDGAPSVDAVTQAVKAFQAAWDLTPDGAVGPKTGRTLAFVTAECEVVG